MDQSNANVANGVSFDTSHLLFEDNQGFFSEIEDFPGFKQTEFDTDFQNESLSNALQLPGGTQWEYGGGWEGNQYGYMEPSYGIMEQEFSNQYFPDMQEFPTNQMPPQQMQYLQPPNTYPSHQTTQFASSPSDYYSGNDSSPHSTNQSESRSVLSTPSSSESTNQIASSSPAVGTKHRIGNLPNGLLKALTTVLTQTNNPAFKQLIKSKETTTTTKGNVSKARKLASKAVTQSETKKVPTKVPIIKTLASNKPSLDEMRRKKADRMIRNREAALQSRKRKLEEQVALEDSCRELQSRNVQLEKQVSFLEGMGV